MLAFIAEQMDANDNDSEYGSEEDYEELLGLDEEQC